MQPLNYEKLEELRKLADIPSNMGEQFIHVDLNLGWGNSGDVRFGFRFKMEMGELEFSSLDQAMQIVQKLRKKATL